MKKREETSLTKNREIKQRFTAGSIFQISIDGNYYYGQMLEGYHIILFDYKSSNSLINLRELKDKSVFFFGTVYPSVFSDGAWPKVGRLEIPDNYRTIPLQWIHHDYRIGKSDEWEIYNSETGAITPSSRQECIGLPPQGIYERSHIIDIIESHFRNEPCLWLWESYKYFPEIYGDSFERIKNKIDSSLW